MNAHHRSSTAYDLLVTPTDLELYRAWQAGDRESGGRLIDRHLAAITRFFATKLPPHADLQDLVASTFERCANGLGQFRGDASFRSYLFKIAVNVLHDHFRRVRPETPVEEISVADLGPSPSAFVAARAQERWLLDALRSLPHRDQIVLELHFFEELGRDDIARILDLPPGTIAGRIRSGRQRLAERLERIGRDLGHVATPGDGLDAWIASVQAQLRRG